MKKIFFIISAIIFWGCAGGRAPRNTERENIARVNHEIAEKGERAYLQEIFIDKPKWDALLSDISGGSGEWLSIAARLHKFSDAGSSEQLKLAVGEGIGKQPDAVFDFIAKNTEFSVNDVCTGIDVDDPRFNAAERAIAELNKRQIALNALPDAKYRDQKEECTMALEKAKNSIGIFFQ